MLIPGMSSWGIGQRLAAVTTAIVVVACTSAVLGLLETWSMRRHLQESDGALAAVRAQARIEYAQEELRVVVHRSARLAQFRQEQRDAFLKAADDYGNEILRLTRQNSAADLPSELKRQASVFEERMSTYVSKARASVRLALGDKRDLASTIDDFEKLRADIKPVRQTLSRGLADYHSGINASARSANAAFGVTGTLSLLLIIGCSVLVVLQVRRTVIGPLRSLTASLAAESVQSDRRDGADSLAGRRDEIGVLARTIVDFKQLSNKQLVLEQEAATRRSAELRHIGALISDLRGVVVNSLAQNDDAATRFKAAAENLGASASKADECVKRVETEFAQTSHQAVSAAQTITEMAESVGAIGEQVNRAVAVVTRSGDSARLARIEVEALAEAAHAIGQVVAFIQQIASQTNLLALNATIEAARAGAAGQGFSVVASEVKALANQSAKATAEIEGRISDIQASTTRAVERIRQIASSFEEIEAAAGAISAAVERQHIATQEIHKAVQNTANRAVGVSSDISAVAKTVGETSGAISDMSRFADVLTSQTSAIHNSIDLFLKRVAA
jgi:methyl-accepting chemotaxis protein